MAKRVLIISSSPRKGGNSDTLADEFARGAEAAGNAVDKIFVCDMDIGYCTGCGSCFDKKPCPQGDDMPGILEAMIAADVIAMATPIYFYGINAQMKTLIDRCCARYEEISGKEFYFLMSAADEALPDRVRTIEGFRAFIYCLDRSKEKGAIYGVGAFRPGEIDEKFKKQAFEMGSAV